MSRCSEPRRREALIAVLLTVAWAMAAPAAAGTDISLYRSFAGPVDFTGTGGSLRTDANGGDACSVAPGSEGELAGLPGGARIEAAYLYWAGSYSNNWRSTQRTPDWDVVFDGRPVGADRTFTETFPYGRINYDFFSGFADVTAQVAAKGNGTYTFSGLGVNTDYPHCDVETVLAGWSLVVVYSHPSRSLHVVNVYDGFRFYQGGEIVVTADNFRIAAADIDGKAAHVTWEGDETNSQNNGGYGESLSFNGHDLTDAYNPPGNQFNSTINVAGRADTWGVDFDIHDVSPWLNAGDQLAVSRYSSGQDLVLLSAEVISVANAPTADLALSVSHTGGIAVGADGDLVLTVTNLGPSALDSDAVVTVTLPPGLDLVAANAGGGWTVDASGLPVITARIGRTLPPGGSLAPVTLTVNPDGTVMGPVAVTASVASGTFDHRPANNTVTTTINVGEPSSALAARKSLVTVSDPFNGAANPKAIPGAFVQYEVEVSNRGTARIDGNTVVVADAVPSGTAMYVGDLPGTTGPIAFVQGDVPSGLSYRFVSLADQTDDVDFSADGGVTWTYVPAPDADGCDAAVTNVRILPQGRMRGRSRTGPSSFVVGFQVRVQ